MLLVTHQPLLSCVVALSFKILLFDSQGGDKSMHLTYKKWEI